MSNEDKMKPVLLIPPDVISDGDLQLLRDNGLCVVIVKQPGAVKFLDPIPASVGRTKAEQAAIELSRKLLDKRTFMDTMGNINKYFHANDISRFYCDLLVKGTALDPEPSVAEIERQVFTQAKREEVQRIAREEARAEAAERRAAKKAKSGK